MGRRKSRFQVCLVLITVSAVIFGSIVPVYAGDPRNNSGGVYDESEYQEVIFVTGEPVIVKGTIDARQSVKNGKGTVSLRFDLKNTDNDEDIKLTRNVTLGVTEETTKTQTVSTMEVKSFSETIKIGKNSL